MHEGSIPAASPIRGPINESVVVEMSERRTCVVVVEPFRDASIIRVVGVIIVTAILVIVRI